MTMMAMKKLAVIALCGLCLSLVGADNHASCFDDVDACVTNLRKILTDDDVFWFGSEFGQRCPPGSFGSDCSNPSRTSKNIIARLFNVSSGSAEMTALGDVVDKIKLADVTFSSPKGSYYGCGHNYSTPAIRHRLDPTSIVTVNGWTLHKPPVIRWESADPSALYTVLVWDVGYYFLHGLYINAVGGDLNSAVPISKYEGPRNPWIRPNIFVFAVFRQTAYVDVQAAYKALGQIMFSNEFMFPYTSFIQAIGGTTTDIVAANVMSVVGDAYSMQWQKESFIRNNCPLLISQLPVLRQVLDQLGVDASWTSEKTILDYKQPPHLSTLTADLSVEYSMAKDVEVTSCCVKTTYTKSMYQPDPLGDHVTRSVLTSSAPRIVISPTNIIDNRFFGVKDKPYTLLMVTMENDVMKTPQTNVIVHWMVTNIHEGDVTTGDQVLPYLEPIPQKAGQPQPYVFLLLEQPTENMAPVNLKDFAGDYCPPVFDHRCNFDLRKMMQSLNLKDVRAVTWFLAEQDSYTRKRIYTEYDMSRLMFDVCNGQPGFEDPCPDMQYCKDYGTSSAPKSRDAAQMLFTSLVAVAVFGVLN